MNVIFAVLSFAVLICILVAVHELGHLLIARANGVFAEAFSIGFGPVLFERKDKYGTKWRLSLIPAGGYVKMFGDADATSVKEDIPEGYSEEDMAQLSLHRKKPWHKLMVAIAGPIFNLIFAVFILFSLALLKGTPEYTSAVTVVGEDSVAYVSGMRTGDKVVKVNGEEVETFEELRNQISKSYGKEMQIELRRDGKTEDVTVKMYKEEEGRVVPIKTLGVAPLETIYRKVGIFESAVSSVKAVYFLAVNNIVAIFKIITNEMSTKNVGGVISIFKMASQSAEAGVYSFLWMMAVLSTVLGAINLLPIPVLDGGTVLISAIEWIIGRPLNKKFVETIFMIGLLIVAGLMILGIWNDLSNCRFFVWLENLFK